jgi:hypothetical protein
VPNRTPNNFRDSSGIQNLTDVAETPKCNFGIAQAILKTSSERSGSTCRTSLYPNARTAASGNFVLCQRESRKRGDSNTGSIWLVHSCSATRCRS